MNPILVETFRNQKPGASVSKETSKEFWGRVRERKAAVKHKKPKAPAAQRMCVYPGCLSTNITRDHIVPQWVYKAYPVDQIDFPRNLGAKNYQDLCTKHNGLKAGHIDCTTEVGRRFWTKFKEAIERELVKGDEHL